MPQKDDKTKSIKCNHKPGDPWEEDGCCQNEQVKDKSDQAIAKQDKQQQASNQAKNYDRN
jgi:hypothetical protein